MSILDNWFVLVPFAHIPLAIARLNARDGLQSMKSLSRVGMFEFGFRNHVNMVAEPGQSTTDTGDLSPCARSLVH